MRSKVSLKSQSQSRLAIFLSLQRSNRSSRPTGTDYIRVIIQGLAVALSRCSVSALEAMYQFNNQNLSPLSTPRYLRFGRICWPIDTEHH